MENIKLKIKDSIDRIEKVVKKPLRYMKGLYIKNLEKSQFFCKKNYLEEGHYIIEGTMDSFPRKINKDMFKEQSFIKLEINDESINLDEAYYDMNFFESKKVNRTYFRVELPFEILLKYLNGEENIMKVYIQLADDNNSYTYRLRPPSHLVEDSSYVRNIVYNGFVVQTYKTAQDNLAVKIIKLTRFDELKEYPVFLNDLKPSNNGYLLEGKANQKILSNLVNFKDVSLFIRKRKSKASFLAKIKWISENKWSSEVDLDKLPVAHGKWDFYFLIKTDSSEKLFKIKTVKRDQLQDKMYYFNYQDKGAIKTIPYQAINNDFSLKTSKMLIRLNKLNVHYSNDRNVSLEGTFDWDSILNKENLKLIFRDRKTEDIKKFPMKVSSSNSSDLFSFQTDLELSSLIDYKSLETKRYDLFFETTFNGELTLIRVHYKSAELLEESKIQVKMDNDVYQTYFYTTVYNNLSMTFKETSIVRDLQKYKIDGKNQLVLSGSCYLDTDMLDSDDSQTTIILKKRDSDKQLAFPMVNTNNNIIDNLFRPNEKATKFSIKIPLNELRFIVGNGKEILDVYIQIENKGVKKERKLGSKEYDYFKDEIMSLGKIIKRESIYNFYLTITPRGNMKIETHILKQQHHNDLIKYNNSYLSNSRKKEIWIVGERPDTAQDTGYHFFKYCRENYPDLEVYYAIEEGSKDVKNISHLGNVLYIGSDEHVKKCLQATALFGSHDLDYILPFKGILMNSYKYATKVFLQHGVLGRKNVEYHKKYYKYPFDIFCVSSRYEKDMVVNKMGYLEEEVKSVGLSRFDNLQKNHFPKREILLIPTWREWLTSSEDLLESEYFIRYNSLLMNPLLNELLEKHQVKIKFYPHYRMQEFFNDIDFSHNPKIELIKLGEKNVQELLKNSSLLITDYSTVSFDFTYMKKPVIFYHFDSGEFFKRGILRPIDETFLGDIVYDEPSLINSISDLIDTNFKEREEIAEKRELIFDQIDRNNSKRIFEEVNQVMPKEEKNPNVSGI